MLQATSSVEVWEQGKLNVIACKLETAEPKMFPISTQCSNDNAALFIVHGHICRVRQAIFVGSYKQLL